MERRKTVADIRAMKQAGAKKTGAIVGDLASVEEAFALEPGDGFLFCVVSRLGWQKGMDILGACIDGLVAAEREVLATLEGEFTAEKAIVDEISSTVPSRG